MKDFHGALGHSERAEKLYWVQKPELMPDATLIKGLTQWRLGDCRSASATLTSVESKRGDVAELEYALGACILDEHHDELLHGVPSETPWLESARDHLRRARSKGMAIDPKMAAALRL
jgi:hypothetical protein